MTTRTAFPQAGVLLPVPPVARYLEFALQQDQTAASTNNVLRTLLAGETLIDGTACVIGLGRSLVDFLGIRVPGLRTFPRLHDSDVDIPSTPQSLWIWQRGDDQGELFHRSRRIEKILAPAFALESAVDAFVYDGGRDLTGYEDGTENPQAGNATDAAITTDSAIAPPGSSFVAVQHWVHDLDAFAAKSKRDQDHTIGRERISNEELDKAPASAHVKRTAQENFDPPSFVVRRSMPWTEGDEAGLVFVAFGATLDPFERLLRRMAGLDDGIVDGLFSFTRPVSGAYYWCPPVVGGRAVIDGLG